VWRPEDLSFELEDDGTSDPVLTATVTTPSGLLRIMAEPEIHGTVLVLRGVHAHGEGGGPNAFGPGNLRIHADAVMERMGFDGIVVEGAVRTTGAGPGRRPGRLRFSRRVRPGPAG
jgi:hypothetical protein